MGVRIPTHNRGHNPFPALTWHYANSGPYAIRIDWSFEPSAIVPDDGMSQLPPVLAGTIHSDSLAFNPRHYVMTVADAAEALDVWMGSDAR